MNSKKLIHLALIAATLIASALVLPGQKHHKSRPVKADVSVKKISRKEIPPEVIASFEKLYPAAEIKGQLKQVREKVSYYEIQSEDSVKSRDIVFQADGVVVEVAESVDESQLPANIAKALKDKYLEGVVTNALSVTRGEHLEYELSIQVGKKSTDVVANLAGKIFTVK